jgi:alanyl-tRNA synthetase
MIVETKRLYFNDPYQWEFSAKIIDRLRHNNFPAIVLDRTCFYPEGGGQPSDKGTINGMEIREVIEHEGRILHILAGEIAGDEVEGKVDGSIRFDHMQQHAGQHVLSQAFYKLYGAETRSFHLGEEVSTVEIAMESAIDLKIEKVEKRANEIVFKNLEIRSYFVEKSKIQTIPLRRPPKKTGTIRVIEVDKFDYTACGGTHPCRTGEIGLIKILRRERIRDNIRCEFLCGWRAFRDYAWKTRDLRILSNQMTVAEKEVVSTFEKFQSEVKDLKKQNRKIREKLVGLEVEETIRKSGGPLIREIFTGKTIDEVRLLALNIIKKGSYVVCFAINDKQRVHLIFARSGDIDIDLRELVPLVSSLVEGKGGGQPSLVQIAGTNSTNLDKAMEKAARFIKEKQSIEVY